MPNNLLFISSHLRDGDYLITNHANDELVNDDVSIGFLEEAVGRDRPIIIEEYKNSCLILGWGTDEEPLHTVVAHRTEDGTIRIVTVYRPDKCPERWENGYTTRRRH